MRKLLVLICALTLTASGCSLLGSRGAREFGRRAPALAGMKVIAFYDDREEKPRGKLLPLVAKYKAEISALTPLWYHVNPDGSVTSEAEADVTQFARREGIPLVPLVNNAKGNGDFLLTEATRRAAVQNLVKLVDKNNYQGIHIDFQLLKPEHKQGLNLFMQRLYAALHPKRKLVSVDVIPIGRTTQPGNAYDFKTLSLNADEVVLMAYDAHDSSSNPGPVAPLAWVEQRVRVALDLGVKPSRLDLGIADYGYDWPLDASGKAVTGNSVQTVKMKDVERKGMAQLEARGIAPQRDADGIPNYTYTDSSGVKHVVWYEDEVSVVRKIQLAKRYKLHELALWRVGYENDRFWAAVKKAAAGSLS